MALSSNQKAQGLSPVSAASPSPLLATTTSPSALAGSPAVHSMTSVKSTGVLLTRSPNDRIDLTGYKRVSKKKQEAADETDVIVSSSGNVRLYIAYALRMLTGGEESGEVQRVECMSKGTGAATLGPPREKRKETALPADTSATAAPGNGDRESLAVQSAAAVGLEPATRIEAREAGGSAGAKPVTNTQQPVDRITVRGTGQAMANAILTAEGVRGKLPGLHLIVRTIAEEVQDEWIPEDASPQGEGTSTAERSAHVGGDKPAQGNQQSKCLLVPRTVYQIIIVITRNATQEEMQDKGYQPPLSSAESGQLFDNGRDFIGPGFRRNRGNRGAARNSNGTYAPARGPGARRSGGVGGRRSKRAGRRGRSGGRGGGGSLGSEFHREETGGGDETELKRESTVA